MSRNAIRLLAAALALGGAACAQDSLSPGSSGLLDLAGAFSSVPVGFNLTQSSFDGTVGGSAWMPHSDHFGGGLMGTGLATEFRGLGFGRGMGPGLGFGGPFGGLGNDCTFNAGSGRVECPARTVNGLTFTRSVAFSDASGKAQSAFDSVTTNTINTRVSVSGTTVRHADDHHGEHGRGHGGPGHDGAGSTGMGMGMSSSDDDGDTIVVTVQNASDRTVSGLARGSTKRTVNGTSAGKESFAGTDSIGAFTAVRVVGDTTKDVVIPVPAAGSSTPTFPTAGTVIRAMQATLTYTGKSPVVKSRREVLTFDGSATAKLVITEDGSTRNCTIALPHGRPVCQ